MDLQFHQLQPFKVMVVDNEVMVVDNDMAHHRALEEILSSFGTPYQISKFSSPSYALDVLKIQINNFDILFIGIPLSNVHAFGLLRFAGRHFNIIVVQMISEYTDDAALQGFLIGASKCVAKPVTSPQILKDVWQYMIRKRGDKITRNFMNSMAVNSSEIQRRFICAATDGRAGPSCSNNARGVNIVEESGAVVSHQDVSKKQRFVWTREYQQIFLEALRSIKPPEKVTPTKVLEYMKRRGVPNITRENVASHLHKHRLLMERLRDKNSIIYESSTSLDENKEPSTSMSYDQDRETLAPPQQLGSSSSPQQILTVQEQQHELIAPQNQPNQNGAIISTSIGHQINQNNNHGDIDYEVYPQQNQITSSTLLDQIPFSNNTNHDQFLNSNHENDLNFNNPYDFDDIDFSYL